MYLKQATFQSNQLANHLNHPDNFDNEDSAHKTMFKGEVHNSARALLYMNQGGHACALKKKIFKTCPDVYCFGLSEQKLPLRINHKSGNIFSLSIQGPTT